MQQETIAACQPTLSPSRMGRCSSQAPVKGDPPGVTLIPSLPVADLGPLLLAVLRAAELSSKPRRTCLLMSS